MVIHIIFNIPANFSSIKKKLVSFCKDILSILKGFFMLISNKLSENDGNIISLKSPNEIAEEDIKKGNIIGISRSLINNIVDKFNTFNKDNEFELKMGNPDTRQYSKGNTNCPPDLVYLSAFSKDGDTLKFIQLFFPLNTIYIILDHLLGGSGWGEYGREFSKLDISILEWYLGFYKNNKEIESLLNYHIVLDLKGAYPLKPLFKGPNIIISYIPMLFQDKIFSEAIIRINLDILKIAIEEKNDSNENDKTYMGREFDRSEAKIFPINRMATDDELDEIVEQILKQ